MAESGGPGGMTTPENVEDRAASFIKSWTDDYGPYFTYAAERTGLTLNQVMTLYLIQRMAGLEGGYARVAAAYGESMRKHEEWRAKHTPRMDRMMDIAEREMGGQEPWQG